MRNLWYSEKRKEFMLQDLAAGTEMPVAPADLSPEGYDFRTALVSRKVYFRTEDGWEPIQASVSAIEALAKGWGYRGEDLRHIKTTAYLVRRRKKIEQAAAV